MKTSVIATLALTIISLPSALFAQGALNPPGAPAPTQKSLQEIWDKIDTLETEVSELQANNDQLTNLLLHIGGEMDAIPWKKSLVATILASSPSSNSSLALTPSGHPAISYQDPIEYDLKYAVYDGTSWIVTTVDGSGDVGFLSTLAFTPGGQPAISYYDDTNQRLKYAVFNGSTWTLTNVANHGLPGSLAFTPGGQPAICYHDFVANTLNYAVFNGSTWFSSAIAGVIGGSGSYLNYYTSLAFSPGGQPAISYYIYGSDNLTYAEFNGLSWDHSTVDDAGDVGKYNSLAFSGGQPSISYYDSTNGDLKYATYDGNGWVLSTVDSAGDVGEYNSLAVTPGGQVGISYFDSTNADLKYAVSKRDTWEATTVQSVGDVGKYNSLVYTSDGQPAISYFDFSNGNANLMFITRQPFVAP